MEWGLPQELVQEPRVARCLEEASHEEVLECLGMHEVCVHPAFQGPFLDLVGKAAWCDGVPEAVEEQHSLAPALAFGPAERGLRHGIEKAYPTGGLALANVRISRRISPTSNPRSSLTRSPEVTIRQMAW